jgi:zinc transport system permease protein
MEALYQLVGSWAQAGYLPSAFEHSFMVRGLFAALLIGPILGGMGTVVVTRNLAFFSQTIGHASLTGVAIGLLFGESIEKPYAGLLGFCLAVALVMTYVKNRARLSSDTVIGVVLSQILGIGIIMLVVVTKQFNVHQVEAILFGSLITVNDMDLLFLLVVSALAAGVGLAYFNDAMLVSFHPILAKARGLRPVLIEYLFIAVLTTVVVASLKLVGGLLVLVLLVVPAAGAQNVASSLRGFFWLTILFSTVSTVSGLLLSSVLAVPTGGAIVLAASALFYASLILRPVFGRSAVRQGES